MTPCDWTIRHLNLAQGVEGVPASDRAHLLVFWWGRLPLGAKALAPQELPFTAEQVLALTSGMIADQVHARAGGHEAFPRAGYDGQPRSAISLAEASRAESLLATVDALAGPARCDAERLSVIVCTRDRPAMLQACLASLAAQAAPPGEVVVVDNSADGGAAQIAQGRPGVVYVHEPRPGLSVARNAGLAAARGAFVAFTDDDVELDSDWTREIVRAFDNPAVDAVTGLVLPASLETEAQRAFQFDLGGFTNRYTPLVFDRSFLEDTAAVGPQVWRIGAGANMAFRRSSLADLGGFDERLGAGASGCSEDSEFWYRILFNGGVCLYEPRAAVYHHHRRDWAGLRSQYRAYMKGHVAALVAQADRYGHAGNIRRIFRQLPSYLVRTAAASIQNLVGWRLRLLVSEALGCLEGLQYLVRPGWRDRTRRAPAPADGGRAPRSATTHA